MAGTLIFDQGVVRNQDLVLKSPLLRIAGQGQADLVSERIDYTLNTTLSATAEGQGGKELTDLKGITIPIKVSGTFDDPSYAPDVAGLAKAKAERALEKNKEKITEKLKEKLGEDAGGVLGETLGGLLGGKKPRPAMEPIRAARPHRRLPKRPPRRIRAKRTYKKSSRICSDSKSGNTRYDLRRILTSCG